MSRTFTDTKGRTWTLALDPWLLTQIKDNTGVLLTKWHDDKWKLATELSANPPLLCDVLWGFCEEQAEANAVESTREFARGLGDNVLIDAFTALDGAVADFCMSPEARRMRENLLEKADKAREIVETQQMEEIAAIDPAQLAKSYLDTVSNSQQSQESTHSPAG